MGRRHSGIRTSPITTQLPVDILDRMDLYSQVSHIPKAKIVAAALKQYLDTQENAARAKIGAALMGGNKIE